MTVGQIVRQDCCGIIVDVQEFFLSLVGEPRQREIKTNIANFARLLGYLKIPLLVTVEKPVARKGIVPQQIAETFSAATARFEKEFFDLAKDETIKAHIGHLNRRQIILAGCETDVCVLQSCLGLLRLQYDVFLVEELLFSSSTNVESAIARMKTEGAVFISYKSLYYELLESIEESRHAEEMRKTFGPFPDDLPDFAITG
jgi:nicotinamidase-related amidase